jgi:hypothetical protein
MFVLNERGEIVIINSRTEKLFGYSAAELVGKKVEIIVPEGFAERRAHARAVEASRVLRARRRDGTEFPAEIQFSPLETDQGTLLSGFIREQLAESEERYRSLFDGMPLGLFRTTPDGAILEANQAMVSMLGYPSRADFLAIHATKMYADPHVRERYIELLRHTGRVQGFATVLRRHDGSEFPAELSASAVTGEDGRLLRIEGSAVDVTERRSLEAQLSKSLKMEAIGQLAGGIAHDFNNLLGAITMFGELAAGDIRPGDPRRADLDNIQEAVQHAATLTRQLLAFSRQQVLNPVALDPNAVIGELMKILRRVIGEDVELITELDPAAGFASADASQLEQVLMNLAVNARDAMPRGGRLLISTAGAELDSEAASAAGLERAGDFVVITVSDTGSGMSPEVSARAFEPFFTTKGDKGTGLGLATVYGIVRQSGGHISVASTPGAGTTFTIHLPRISGTTAERPATREQASPRGSETILLAEDDATVRLAVSSVLSRLGYTLLVARTAEAALAKAREHAGPIHLVISDVVMPGMDGSDLIQELRRARPETRALLTSGYSGDAMRQHQVIESGVPFLEKPFTADYLAQRVRGVLDGIADTNPK